jgi:hypothetical protein
MPVVVPRPFTSTLTVKGVCVQGGIVLHHQVEAQLGAALFGEGARR